MAYRWSHSRWIGWWFQVVQYFRRKESWERIRTNYLKPCVVVWDDDFTQKIHGQDLHEYRWKDVAIEHKKAFRQLPAESIKDSPCQTPKEEKRRRDIRPDPSPLNLEKLFISESESILLYNTKFEGLPRGWMLNSDRKVGESKLAHQYLSPHNLKTR